MEVQIAFIETLTAFKDKQFLRRSNGFHGQIVFTETQIVFTKAPAACTEALKNSRTVQIPFMETHICMKEEKKTFSRRLKSFLQTHNSFQDKHLSPKLKSLSWRP